MGNEGLFPEMDEGLSARRGQRPSGSRKVVFKADHRREQYLLPPSLDEFVPKDHLARFIDTVVDGLDISNILARYKGGGASAFHPRTMLKIWLFGWTRKIYTSRPLAHACTRDVEFMWIAGTQTPSFMTLSEFRKSLGKDIKTIFKEVVKLAMTAGAIDGSEVYIDHTKIEANSNRHKITWRKNVERYLEKVEHDLDKLLEMIDRLNDEEDRDSKSPDQPPAAVKITPEMLDALTARINQQLKEGKKDREEASAERAQVRQGKERLKQQQRYQEALEKLGDKNSMAKNDPEAPAMMMKDKLSIKPGYNVGIATQNGIVTGYEVSDNANDGVSFKSLLVESGGNLETPPQRVCADAGYGTTENYQHLEAQGIESYVKYPGWDKDLKGKRSPFEAESFRYEAHDDTWICPNQKVLSFVRIERRTNKRTGYCDESREYRAKKEDCGACPFKANCTKMEARSIRVNNELRTLRQQAVKNLSSPMGERMRSRRSVEVETIFGIQKHALGFTRLHLRGKMGAAIETGLFFTANNIRRLHKKFVQFLRNEPSPLMQFTGS